MHPLKRAVLSVCVWLGGDDPRREQMPTDHSWLVPGPSLLNTLIAWANPQPLSAVPATMRPRPRTMTLPVIVGSGPGPPRLQERDAT